jgi:hypothetical protein
LVVNDKVVYVVTWSRVWTTVLNSKGDTVLEDKYTSVVGKPVNKLPQFAQADDLLGGHSPTTQKKYYYVNPVPKENR